MSKNLTEYEKAVRTRKRLDTAVTVFGCVAAVVLGLLFIGMAAKWVWIFWNLGMWYVPVALAVLGGLMFWYFHLERKTDKILGRRGDDDKEHL